MIRNFHRHEDGFVLIEFLLSVAILGAVLGTVYVVYFQSRDMFSGFSNESRKVRVSSMLWGQVRADLSGVTRQKAVLPLLSGESGNGEAGEEVILRFISVLQRGTAPPTPHLVTYFLRKEAGKETRVLYRREEPPGQEGKSASNEMRLLMGVSEAKIEAFHGEGWTPGWPDDEIPRLLRLSFSLQGVGGGTSSRAWIFELPVEKRPGGTGTEAVKIESEKVEEKTKEAGKESEEAGGEETKTGQQNEKD